MRAAAEVHVRKGAQKSASLSLPSPVGGLNARDSIANMSATDALVLDNYFPQTTNVAVRNGYAAWSTFTGICQSILVYTGLTATKVFPCVKNGSTYSIFDGTSAGALSSVIVGGSGPTVQALTSTRFDYANFGTTGGQYFVAVNGTDTPLQFDGTTWIASAMTGLTTANLFTVAVYGRRLWFAEKNTFNVWYLPVDSITGALTKLHLGPLFKLGGYISSILTVTTGSTSGITNYIAFLSSEGEIVAFEGDDPSSAATWAESSHIRIGRPVCKGNRAWCKFGPDALVLCSDGVYPLRRSIADDSRSAGLAVSDKIRNLVNRDLAANGTRLGWQLTLHPTGSKLIVNVPTNEDVSSYQYVMNSQTSAWCRFTGWNAVCFEVARDTLYFGKNGKMVKADTTAYDGTDSITAEAMQAYNYLGNRGRTKHMKMIRPLLTVSGACQFCAIVNRDFQDVPVTVLRSLGLGNTDPWNGAWDVAWSGADSIVTDWFGAVSEGHAIAVRTKAVTQGTTLSWAATDLVYEVGNYIG
jgi:hypothetical protein